LEPQQGFSMAHGACAPHATHMPANAAARVQFRSSPDDTIRAGDRAMADNAKARAQIEVTIRAGEQFCACCDEVIESLEELAASCDAHHAAQGGGQVGVGVIAITGGVLLLFPPTMIAGAIVSGVAVAGGAGHAGGSYLVNKDKSNELIELSEEFEEAAGEYDQAFQAAGKVGGQCAQDVANLAGEFAEAAGERAMRDGKRAAAKGLGVVGGAAAKGLEAVIPEVRVATKGLRVFGGVIGIATGVFDVACGIKKLCETGATSQACGDLITIVEDHQLKVQATVDHLRMHLRGCMRR